MVKFYQNKKLLKEQSFKQGFYREHLVKLNKSMILDGDADYAEVAFVNEKLKFSKGFSFVL